MYHRTDDFFQLILSIQEANFALIYYSITHPRYLFYWRTFQKVLNSEPFKQTLALRQPCIFKSAWHFWHFYGRIFFLHVTLAGKRPNWKWILELGNGNLLANAQRRKDLVLAGIWTRDLCVEVWCSTTRPPDFHNKVGDWVEVFKFKVMFHTSGRICNRYKYKIK